MAAYPQRGAWWPVLLVGLACCGILVARPACAGDAVPVAMTMPAHITPHAPSGLMVSIARAGANLVAAGEHGWILISSDNGRTWREAPSPTSVTLTRVMFTDAADGWALGQMGVVLQTENGGLTWRKTLDGIAANQIILAAAQADIAARGSNDVTTNNLQAATALAGGGPSVPFLDILATSPAHLLLVGGFGLAMQSADDGRRWTSAAVQLANPQALHLYGLAKTRGTVYISGEQGLLLKGPPGGPYNPVTTPFGGTFFGVLAAPDGVLFVYGLQGTVLRSADAGATWRAVSGGGSAGVDAGLLLQDGRLLFGDAAGNLLVGHEDAPALTAMSAGEPIAALAQASDGAIIIGGPFGLRRVPLSALGAP